MFLDTIVQLKTESDSVIQNNISCALAYDSFFRLEHKPLLRRVIREKNSKFITHEAYSSSYTLTHQATEALNSKLRAYSTVLSVKHAMSWELFSIIRVSKQYEIRKRLVNGPQSDLCVAAQFLTYPHARHGL